MKIVFIVNSIKNKAGTERVVCILANFLVEKLNFTISIINRDTTIENVAYQLNKSIKVITFPGNIYSFYKQMQNYFNENKINYVLIHNMGKLSILCSFLKLQHTQLVSLEHVSFNSRPFWLRILSKIFYQKRIDQVITLTDCDKLNYISWFNKKIFTIHNISPFKIKKYDLSNKQNKIISIGRLTYQKNFHALLSAWKIISPSIQDWILEIYGTGEDYESLQNFIIYNNLKNVKLMGNVENIEDIYKQASIFVMTSRFEGLPMVLIEAQTFGLPIISFDCPYGPKEVIKNNSNGFLIENQNIELLSKSMLQLISSPMQRLQFSQQALKDAQKFQWNEILKLWENNVFKK